MEALHIVQYIKRACVKNAGAGVPHSCAFIWYSRGSTSAISYAEF